jgi:Holliday junction resolvase RusA-like endonuclease
MRKKNRPGAKGIAHTARSDDLADHAPDTGTAPENQPVRRRPLTVIISIPPPPSVNNLFLTRGRRRVRTPRYRRWQTAAGWQLLAQKQGCIGGPWQADIVLPQRLRGDTDNYAKPILDLLVAHGVVDDDRHCKRLSIEKIGTSDSVTITLRAAT